MRIKYGLMCLSLLSCVGIDAVSSEQKKQLEETRKRMAGLQVVTTSEVSQSNSSPNSSPSSSRPNSNEFYCDSPCGSTRQRTLSDENVPKFNLRDSNPLIWPHFR